MGKLLTGHYGEEPEAESTTITLNDCRQKLGLKPTDFVSAGAPDFFKKKYGVHGRYLFFLMDAAEVASNPVWKSGYYLLPMEAAEVLRVFQKNQGKQAGAGGARILPVTIETSEAPPDDVMARAQRWATESQPLFFKCKCDHLEMKLTAPWGIRRRWKAKLVCPDRCQPTLTIPV